MKISRSSIWLAVSTCPLVALPALAQTDSNMGTPQAAVTGPSYSSFPGSFALPEGNSPEADGRPGMYYFNLGADAFHNKDYTHAIEMYKVAASWAYKPAEYDLALMYYKGTGAPADPARGTAWMVLAAERNDKSYVAARDFMATHLSKADFERAVQIAEELLPTYGDTVALRRAEHRWHQVKTEKTGSLTGNGAGELRVGTLGEESPATIKPPIEFKDDGIAAHQAVTAGDILKDGYQDGSVVYRQFEESNNPYDAKFAHPTSGTATVGPLNEVKDSDDTKSEKKPSRDKPSGDADHNNF